MIKSVIDWQLNHAKPRVAKTKQRNEIKGSTKKIVAQKGSGGARHASKKAPLFVGGGVKSQAQMINCWKAGADIVVIGNYIENNFQKMYDFNKTTLAN